MAFNGTTVTATCTQNGTTLTVSGYTTAATDVGNILQITGGTNFITGFYQITAQGAGTWTLDRTPATAGAGSAMTGGMGGALVSPGKAGAAHVAGNTIYIKSGTYTITSASTNIAGGCLSLMAGVAANATKVYGYGSSRGDNGTKPLLQVSAITTATLVTLAADCYVSNIAVDGTSATSIRGFSVNVSAQVYRCQAKNCTNNGFNTGNATLCEANGCSTQPAFNATTCLACVADGNTVSGFQNGAAFGCYAINNTGTTSDGFTISGQAVIYSGCVAFGNGRDGFRTTGSATASVLASCISASNGASTTGVNYNASAAMDGIFLFLCAGWASGGNNTTNVGSNITAGNNTNFITLTGNPFTNAAGNNYALNNTGGAGAACQAAGLPGAASPYLLPGISTNAYTDLGGVTHQSTSGGGAAVLVI